MPAESIPLKPPGATDSVRPQSSPDSPACPPQGRPHRGPGERKVAKDGAKARWAPHWGQRHKDPTGGSGFLEEPQSRYVHVQSEPGRLYGALARLEDSGLVRALPAQKRRHPYQVTAAGTAALTNQLRRDEKITRVGLARIGVQPA